MSYPNLNYRRAFAAVQGRLWPRAQVGAPAPWDLNAILIGLMVPMSMMILNMTMFGVALPAIRNDFMAQADTVAWLVTAYTLPFVLFMPLYGRLSDGMGKRRLFSIGIIVFLVGTLVCLLSDNLTWLIVGRALQGIGTAGLNPLCIAVITEVFPSRARNKALATWSSVGPATGMLSPFMGGLLVDHFGWKSMFWLGLAAAVAALWAVNGRLPKLLPQAQPGFLRSFDWVGMGLLSGTITLLVAYLSSRALTGVEPLLDWRLAAGTLLFGLGFWGWERRHANPLIPFTLLKAPGFARTSLAAGLRMVLMSSEGFLVPLYMADVYGVSGSQLGILITLHAGALLLTVRVGGRLADRWSRRLPVSLGFAGQMAVMIYLANLPATVPIWVPALGIMAHGGAAGLSLAVLHRLAMDGVPVAQAGAAAGIYSMGRFFGSIVGTTIGGVVLTQARLLTDAPIDTYHIAFWCWSAVALLAVMTIWPVRDRVAPPSDALPDALPTSR